MPLISVSSPHKLTKDLLPDNVNRLGIHSNFVRVECLVVLDLASLAHLIAQEPVQAQLLGSLQSLLRALPFERPLLTNINAFDISSFTTKLNGARFASAVMKGGVVAATSAVVGVLLWNRGT